MNYEVDVVSMVRGSGNVLLVVAAAFGSQRAKTSKRNLVIIVALSYSSYEKKEEPGNNK